jgi:SMC interacting uncharacterized protein involved in chromosome segregation
MNNKIESAIKSIKYESIRYDEAVLRLNKMVSAKNKQIEQLEQQLKEANGVIFKLARNGVDLSVHTEAIEYKKKWSEKC